MSSKKTSLASNITPDKEKNISTKSDFYTSNIKGKELYILLGLILISCFIIFQDFISGKKVYLFKDIGSDSINIFYPWLVHMREYISTNGTPAWTFSQGMGQNLFPLWLGDFFSNFLMFFVSKENLAYGLVFMEIIKIILAGFVFFKYLKELKIADFSSYIGAFLFALCGYIILGGCWTIFSVEALYLAIILYGFERWLNHKKWIWFVIGLTCMSFLQPFFLFMYAIFLAIYITVRYQDLYPNQWRSFSFFILKTLGLSILAVAISAYQLLPDILQYTESPRVGGEASFFNKLKSQSMFGVADELLRFTTTFRAFGSDMLGTGSNFKGWMNYLEAPLFYCGILCLITFPQMFSGLNKKQKISYGILTGIFALPIIFPYFRYSFWAFSGDYFRTLSLVISLLMIIYTAKAIDYIIKTGKINKIVLGVTVLILLFLLYSPQKQFKTGVNENLRTIATLLIFVYSVILFGLSSKGEMKSISKLFLIAICFIEMTYFSNTTVNKRDVVTGKELKEKIGYNDYTVDAVSFLKSKDLNFFRINKDYSSGMAIHASINDAKVQGYYGTSCYFSFNQKNYIKFLGDLNVIDVKDENSTRWAKGLGERPILFSLASGKYWLSKRTDGAVKNMGFDSIAKFGDVTVFKNRFALPFGFTYEKGISEDEFKKLSPTQKDFCLLRACVIGNEDKTAFNTIKSFNVADTVAPITFDNYQAYSSELKKDEFEMSKFSENNIIGTVHVNEPKVLFFSIPFDEGWKATLNGEDVKLYRLNCGLTGLLINKGRNKIELSFTPRFLKIGGIVSIISLVVFLILLFLNYKRLKQDA